jgi:hypothetical protein
MLSELRASQGGLLSSIRDQREITGDTEKGLSDFLEGFARTFA